MSTPTKEVLRRILNKRIIFNSDCWETSFYCVNGYPRMRIDEKNYLVHRIMWMIANKKSPGSLLVLHTCDNRKCCNPAHLFLGTNQDNMLDMTKKGRGKSGSQKILPEQIPSILLLLEEGKTTREVGKIFHVSHSTICAIKNKQRTYTKA